MSGNPATNTYTCTMSTSLPASIFGQSIPNVLNIGGSQIWNDAIGGALGVERFVGQLNASFIEVTNSRWEPNASTGNCNLVFSLTITTDPATSDQIGAALTSVWDLFLIAFGVGLAALGPAGIATDILGFIVAAIGALQLFAVNVVPVAVGIGGGLLTIGLPLLLLAGGAVVVYAIYKSPKAQQRVAARVVGA